MFCKPPHPVYIVLFRGDDTDFVGNQEIIVKITTERDISGCKAYFKYMGNIQTFDEIPEDKELHLVFSREQTKEMPLGTWDAELYLIDENGKRMTVNNRIHMLVTNSVREAYFPDDPQAVSVVISANKYIEDAEVSADGKTLTLTKKDGTEVSFSGGGGGGTDDYNDLENKPTLNGKTLQGAVILTGADIKTSVNDYKTVADTLAEKADEFTEWITTNLPAGVTITSGPEWSALDGRWKMSTSDGLLWEGISAAEDAIFIQWYTEAPPYAPVSNRKRVLLTGDADKLTDAQKALLDGGPYLPLSGGTMNDGATIKLNSLGASIGGGPTDGTVYIEARSSNNPGVFASGAINLRAKYVRKNNEELATEKSIAPKYSPSSAYAVGSFVFYDGNIYQCTTAIADGGEEWNVTHWELRKLDDFFTESNSVLTATIDARLPYPLYAVPSTGVLKDRTLNTTSLASVTVPDNFTDLLIRASVASSLSVTMPEVISTKYGDTFPSEAGEYLITITKTGASEAYVRTIKLEVANA